MKKREEVFPSGADGDRESRIENCVKETQEGKRRWSSGTGGKIVEEANHKRNFPQLGKFQKQDLEVQQIQGFVFKYTLV